MRLRLSCLLAFILVCVVGAWSQTTPVNLLRRNDNATHAYQIAMLHVNDAGTLDHLHLLVTLNCCWASEKVAAENGSIGLGDLMVSSSFPGYAMKGTDNKIPTGSVIGKALGAFKRGNGCQRCAGFAAIRG